MPVAGMSFTCSRALACCSLRLGNGSIDFFLGEIAAGGFSKFIWKSIAWLSRTLTAKPLVLSSSRDSLLTMNRIIPDNPLQDWLIQPIFINGLVYIDRWSLVHFSSGLILGYLLLSRWQVKRPWLTMFTILVAYEVVEYLLGPILFYPEPFIDLVWDLIIGTAGFTFVRFFKGVQYQERICAG